MAAEQKVIPKWILIVSGLFAAMEILVSVSLWFSPQQVLEMADLNAKGVDYIIHMWAGRQFALGFIFAFAAIKKSAPMLLITYIFFLVMFISDFVVGISQKENSLIISSLVMCVISSVMIAAVNKRR